MTQLSTAAFGSSSDLFQTLVIFSSSGGMKVITSTVADDANRTQTCPAALFFFWPRVFCFLLKIYVNDFLFNNVCFLIIELMYAHCGKHMNALTGK